MSRCTDCKGGTPHAMWTRCEDCALRRLRAMMSPIPIAPTERARRFARGDRVSTPLGVGSVVRVTHERESVVYVVQLEGGARYYGDRLAPHEEETAS